MSGPLVAVTGPSRYGHLGWVSAKLALRRAGARARRVRPPFDRSQLEGVSAVVIGGGTHVEPTRYQQTHLTNYLYDAERDELEWLVLEHAMAARLPVLGICRGAQVLNVFCGGTLFQDLVADMPGVVLRPTYMATKRIALEPDTVLATVMGVHDLRVNSLHRQGINRLGRRLRISARDAYGVVQAIESTDAASHFVVGVQWHPEYLPGRRTHQRLFRALVAATKSAEKPSASPVDSIECR